MSRKYRRDPQREQFWRDAVAAWKASGQSIRDFCARRSLPETSFYSWRRTLSQRDRQQRSATPRAPTLVPWRVVPDAVLEVVLPTGLVVRVPLGVEASAVATLIAALRTAPC